MSHGPCIEGKRPQNQDPAVDCFYSAAKRRSRRVLWSIFALALTPAEELATLIHETGHELLHRGDRRTAATRTIAAVTDGELEVLVCLSVDVTYNDQSLLLSFASGRRGWPLPILDWC